MITNSSYKHCVCDGCGKVEDIPSILLISQKWVKVSLLSDLILCQECAEKVDLFIRKMKGNKK